MLFFLTIQQEDFENSFHPHSIQQMELTVLTSLDWRINCITAHSFLSLLTHRWSASLRPSFRLAGTERAIELLIGAALGNNGPPFLQILTYSHAPNALFDNGLLLDLEFLEFSPFAIAISAVKRTADELALPESVPAISDLDCLTSQEHDVR